MSRDAPVRPRRIVGLSAVALEAAPRCSSATASPTARRTVRFQRELYPKIDAPPCAPCPAPAPRAPARARGASLDPSLEAPEITPPDGPLPATRRAADLFGATDGPPLTSANALAPAPAAPLESDTEAALHRDDVPELRLPAWGESIAGLVAELCRRADGSFSHWSVVIPIDAHALPDTELRLDLSPERLLLRFCTQSREAMNLLCDHGASLAALLTQALPNTPEIEIELT